jgi:cell division septum initiation protein DivIVA
MDVLALIDKLDDLVHNARAVPLTDQVRIDREAIYDLLDQMRSTIPEEVKQARWIVKERTEMLAEAKREADRILAEAKDRAARVVSDEEIVKAAQREADHIMEDARARERDVRLGAEDYADEVLGTLEVNLGKFLSAVRRGREQLQGKASREAEIEESPALDETTHYDS